MSASPVKLKTGAIVNGKLALPDESSSKVLTSNSSGQVTASVTTDAELAFVSGVSSPIQTQINTAQADATQGINDAAAAQADIDAHIADSTGAHAASAISNTPSGNLTSTDVQAALNELQTELDGVSTLSAEIDDLVTLSGVPVNSTDLGTFTGSIIPDNTTVKNALQSLESSIEALPDPIYYAGTYNASTNTPALANTDTGKQGALYQVSAAGTHDFGAGAISFEIGDKVVNNGSIWEKWDLTDAVTSVNGQTGNVILTTTEISEGTNLYFSDEKAQDAVGAMVASSSTVSLTYVDATPSLTAAAITQLSITSDASGIKLVNDSATPGNTFYYGTNASGTKGFYAIPAVGSAGDIQETSFAMSNNVSSPANITGFAFANAVVRSFEAQVSVAISATSSKFEVFKLSGIQISSNWNMSIVSTGDDSGVVFSITSAGAIQYTSANTSGFTAGKINFRAQTTSV